MDGIRRQPCGTQVSKTATPGYHTAQQQGNVDPNNTVMKRRVELPQYREDQLIEWLIKGTARHALALPFTEVGFYADLLLITDKGDMRIAGAIEELAGGNEASYLDLSNFEPGTYWDGANPYPPYPKGGWNPIDLLNDNDIVSVRRILTRGRTLQMYRNKQDFEDGLKPKGVLKSASAIRLRPAQNLNSQLVIYATPKYPLGLQITCSPQTIDKILADLTEFSFCD